ncbi:MAG: ATP-binding protein [Holophagaceae bacterium]|nr:ATP-binding protein [Holophagaceae bacterium]
MSVAKVRILGAESTGKTTLARDLAARYHTAWVPEFGRAYTEAGKGGFSEGLWVSEEFSIIANAQNRMEDEAEKKPAVMKAGFLVCDTDALATAVWHERYMGFWSREVAKLAEGRTYALTLLSSMDVPFVQDGFRDGERLRRWMTARFEEVLESRNLPFHWIEGNQAERLEQASKLVEVHILGRAR